MWFHSLSFSYLILFFPMCFVLLPYVILWSIINKKLCFVSCTGWLTLPKMSRIWKKSIHYAFKCRSSALGVCGENTLHLGTGDEWTPLPQEDQITGVWSSHRCGYVYKETENLLEDPQPSLPHLLVLPRWRTRLPWWPSGKESTSDAGDAGSVPGSRTSPGEGNGNHPLQCFCLGNPRDREALWATVHEVPKSQTRLSN